MGVARPAPAAPGSRFFPKLFGRFRQPGDRSAALTSSPGRLIKRRAQAAGSVRGGGRGAGGGELRTEPVRRRAGDAVPAFI